MCDDTPSGLLDKLKCFLPFAGVVAEDIVCEETDVLEKIILQNDDLALGRESALRLRQIR